MGNSIDIRQWVKNKRMLRVCFESSESVRQWPGTSGCSSPGQGSSWRGAAPGSTFMVLHLAPAPSRSSLRRGTEQAHLLGIACLLIVPRGTPWSYIYTCRDLQPSPEHIQKSGGSGKERNSQVFCDSQGWLVHRHPIANCRSLCHQFQ